MKIRQIRDLAQLDITEITNYHSKGAAGIDLVCAQPHGVSIGADSCALVPTGIAVELPVGYFGFIRPRSGIARDHRVTTLSSCIIDEDYRGEIFVNLINHGKKHVEFFNGQRIAQLVVLPYYKAKIEWVHDLAPSERGNNGHGSTGL